MNGFASEAFQAVSVYGARKRLFANDDGKTALLVRIRHVRKRKKASIRLSSGTKHAMYITAIREAVRFR